MNEWNCERGFKLAGSELKSSWKTSDIQLAKM